MNDHRRFDLRESMQGATEGGYDPERDATYCAFPIRIRAASALEAVARAQVAAEILSLRVDTIPEVHWITNPREATYALLSNCVTALESLSPSERVQVLVAFPALDRLEAMLRPPRG